MGHRHILAVDPIARAFRRRFGCEMRNELMAVEVEIHPAISAAPFRAAKQPAIESPCRGKVVHRKGQMEGGKRHELALRDTLIIVETFVNPP